MSVSKSRFGGEMRPKEKSRIYCVSDLLELRGNAHWDLTVKNRCITIREDAKEDR